MNAFMFRQMFCLIMIRNEQNVLKQHTVAMVTFSDERFSVHERLFTIGKTSYGRNHTIIHKRQSAMFRSETIYSNIPITSTATAAHEL